MNQQKTMALSGTFSDGVRASKLLEEAAARFHLVSPATACGVLPEGCSLAICSVQVDVANETYDVGGGKRAMSKSALERVAMAAGVSWDAARTRRLDDGRDPRYCMFVAVGRVRAFDGSESEIQGTKEMDLRDGSPQVEILITKASAKNRDHKQQLREIRQHIVSHAESKAKLRAIRSLGVRSSYAPQELSKPFVCARLMFTGESADPELRRAFAMARADAFFRPMGGSRDEAPRMALPAPMTAPPLTLAAALDDDDAEELDLPRAAVAHVVAPPPPVEHVDVPPSAPLRLPANGPDAGQTLARASDDALAWWVAKIESAIADGKVRDELHAKRFVQAMNLELAGRASTPGDAR